MFSTLLKKLRAPFRTFARIDAIGAEVQVLRAIAEDARLLIDQIRNELHAEVHYVDRRNTELRQQVSALFNRAYRVDHEEVGAKYFAGLHSVGVLNYENDVVSGERRFLTRFVEQFPTAVVLDIGANAGQYAELVREIGPQTSIHSFEPHPASFSKLQHVANRIGAFVYPLAIGDSNSDIEFYDYADEQGSQHASVYRDVIEGIHRRPASSIIVRCETLDQVAERLGITDIDLLKIDTEGFELAVLKGGRRLLDSGAIKVIQFEFNEMNVISRVFIKDFFDLLPNYKIYRLLSTGAIEFQVYDPTFMEVFAYQNIACIRRDVDPFWIHLE